MKLGIRSHKLKCWPKFFQPLIDGEKTWEVRKNDRGFQEGDVLDLAEWNPSTQHYTGRQALFRITYITELPQLPGNVGMTVRPFLVDAEEVGGLEVVQPQITA